MNLMTLLQEQARIRPRVAAIIAPDGAPTFLELDRAAAQTAALLQAAEAGEIVVSGAHVLRGYLGGLGDAETKFEVDGVRWHRTGDAGYLDAHGRLWLLGRASARVTDARGVLFPFSVECAATIVPGVRRSALVSHRGRRVLVVEVSRALDLDGLRSRLAWAQLDAVREVERIPVDKRHNAKVDYPALTKLIEHMATKETLINKGINLSSSWA